MITPSHEKLRLENIYCLFLEVRPEAFSVSQGWKPCAQLCPPIATSDKQKQSVVKVRDESRTVRMPL